MVFIKAGFLVIEITTMNAKHFAVEKVRQEFYYILLFRRIAEHIKS